VTGGDELARQRLERAEHPSTMPPAVEDDPPMEPDDSFSLSVDELPSVVRARLTALENVVAEVADELERRGVHDAADRLRGALP
jgi:hypothetical protein